MGRPKMLYEKLKETIESTGCTLLSLPEEIPTLKTPLRIRCKCGAEFSRQYTNWKCAPFCVKCNKVSKTAMYNEHLAMILIAKVMATYDVTDPYEIALRIEDMLLPRFKGNLDSLYRCLARLRINTTSDICRLMAQYGEIVREYMAMHPEFVEEIRENLYR